MWRSIILALALATSLAACATPAPTGTYAVGRTTRLWVDASRPETMTPATDDRREVPVIIWHPAAAGSGSSAPYFPGLGKLSKTMTASGATSGFQTFALRFVPSHERLNARLPDEKSTYPVILLSPGNGTNVEFYDTIAADLASHGYVVVGVNHPYDVGAVALSNGHIAQFIAEPADHAAWPAWFTDRVAVRTADLLFVLDRLGQPGGGGDPFARDRLDLDHVGAIGHSVGGITAAQACYASAKVLACANVDGLQRGSAFAVTQPSAPPKQPFMMITKEKTMPLSPDSMALFQASPSNAFLVVIAGASHNDFTDAGMLAPIPSARKRGAGILAIARTYALAFFDQALRGKDSGLLTSPVSDERRRFERFGAR